MRSLPERSGANKQIDCVTEAMDEKQQSGGTTPFPKIMLPKPGWFYLKSV